MKLTTTSRKNLCSYMGTYLNCTEHGDSLIEDCSSWYDRINNTDEFKTLKDLAWYLFSLSEEFVILDRSEMPY